MLTRRRIPIIILVQVGAVAILTKTAGKFRDEAGFKVLHATALKRATDNVPYITTELGRLITDVAGFSTKR